MQIQLNPATEDLTLYSLRQGVGSALRRIEGVQEAHVNLASGLASVEHGPERAPVRLLPAATRDEGRRASPCA